MTTCPTGKVAHETKGAAWKHAAELRQRKYGSPDIKPYRCVCGSFHVGHSQVSLRRRINRALRYNSARPHA